MNINAPPGTKIVFDKPQNGYPIDQKLAKAKLTVGAVYTVERTNVGQSLTSVFLVEHPGTSFNSVQFSDIKE